MKKLLLLAFFFMGIFSYAQNGVITLTDDNMGQSFAKNVLLIEDAEHKYSWEDIMAMPESEFDIPKDDVPNLDFTTSTWWIKFDVKNHSMFSYFILETARPITNFVEFFEVKAGKVENYFKSGDDIKYSDKAIPHNKSLFPLYIFPEQSKSYVIKMTSDGEVITLPVFITDRMTFFEKDANEQWSLGFYYGLMALVVIIYFFFFILLKDRAFLYYIMYVAAQALLQFGLDGYALVHFFPQGGYLANHFIIFIAGLTILVLLNYVNDFLNLKVHNRLMLKIFRVCQILVAATIVLSLIPGMTYEISYPIINAVSLLSVILSVVAIYRLKYKKVPVDNWFSIAFTVLIVGAVIFILGNFNIVGNAGVAQIALKISSAMEVCILSISMSNKYRKLQKEKEEAQALALKSLEEQNALVEGMNVKLEAQVKERTAEIEKQKEELAEINEEILSSIHYAKRIQTAILPSDAKVKRILPSSFIFYRPKDVVSGDFYFVDETTPSGEGSPLAIFAAVDCTGHGVPGAFMSIVGSNYLTASLSEPSVNTTAEALDFLNKGVVKALQQQGGDSEETIRDGMDLSLCALDKANRKVYFSGAKNPLYLVRKGEEVATEFGWTEDGKNPLKMEGEEVYLHETKGDSHPIGAYVGEELKPFSLNTIDLKKGDMIYVFSDGYADQFGGESGKKYKYKTFKKFLMSISQLPIEDQKEKLIAEYDRWKGDFEQIDDVLVMGIRID